MGKRKERRLAALSGAGRRVKLDLWTDDGAPGSEATGAVASTSLHDEAGGHVDQSHGAGVPSSPSSSGPHQENPLSLLGQYSDDELGEEESKETKNAAVLEPTPSGCASEQVVDFLADLQNHGLLDDNSDHKKGVAEDNINIEHKSSDLENSVSTVVDENTKEETAMNITEVSAIVIKDSDTLNIPDLGTVQKQSTEHIENEWKAVMHEESGQYYYWNIRTGETTWVMPSTLVQEVTTVSEEKDPLKVESPQDISLALNEGSNEGSIDEEPGVPGVQLELTSSSIPPHALVVSAGGDKEQEMLELKNECHLDEQVKEANGEAQQTHDQKNVELKLNNVLCPVNESQLEDVGPTNSILPENTVDGDFTNEEMKISGVDTVESNEEPKGHQQLPCPQQDVQEQSPNPVELLKWSETLSQRFKALEGTSDTVQAATLRLRYAMEAEIRLADCKALSSCGGSLEPYWLHVQAQLKRLESVLCVEEAAISAGAQQSRLLHSRHKSSTSFLSFRSRIASRTMSNESGMSEQDKILEPVKADYHVTSPKIEQCMASPTDDHMPSPQDDGHTMSSQDEEHTHSPKDQTCKASPDQLHICNDTSNDLEEGEIMQLGSSNVTEITTDVASSPEKTEELCLKMTDTSFERLVENSDVACEDVDMEVDMEVDDQSVTEASIHVEAGLSSVDGKVLQTVTFDPSLPSVTSVVTTGSGSLFPILVGDDVWEAPPQPPEEDWAPPPPPDGESMPPPPPDEPPPSPLPPLVPSNGYEEPLCPVLPYTEQYTSAYVPVANYNYYPSASSESVNPNYYVPADVQTDGTQLSYYDHTVNAYAEGSGLVNPVEGVIYYEPGSITLPDSLEPNDPEYSMYYENVGASTYYGSSGVTNDTSQVSAGNAIAVTADSLGALSAAEVASNQVSVSVASSSTVSAAVVPSTAGGTGGVKGLSKDVRGRKRSTAVAPTLRSNKKVSSLVDKWKAAKEELHGSDDEDENEKALEVMEKKRQREIEEWRMQQIATGEAQDNANFQPLGGDWRERVKRRKTESVAAKAKSETAPVTANAESNGVAGGKKPNLAELSKDLPTGWQAFWDESSGEVYYGNLTTSETMWDRPK